MKKRDFYIMFSFYGKRDDFILLNENSDKVSYNALTFNYPPAMTYASEILAMSKFWHKDGFDDREFDPKMIDKMFEEYEKKLGVLEDLEEKGIKVEPDRNYELCIITIGDGIHKNSTYQYEGEFPFKSILKMLDDIRDRAEAIKNSSQNE